MLDLIKTELPNLKYDNGTRFAKYLGNNNNLSASTVSAASDRVVCSIRVNVTHGGRSQSIRGRFTYREFANGKATASFAPFY